MTGYIVSIVGLVLLSSFFSATETAFTSLSRVKIKNMAADDVRNADLVLELTDRYDQLLSTILIGNNIANIVTTAIATVLFIKIYGNIGATVATVVVTVVVLIFGEITPKNLAKDKPEEFALFAAPLINVIRILLMPLNWIFSLWRKLLDVMFGPSDSQAYSEDELITLVEEAKTEGSLGEAQSELITNAIEFESVEAIDVVTPRVDIVAIELGTSKKEIGQVFKSTGLSRLPVYEDDLDNIIGVLNQKDYHNYVIAEHRPVQEYIKPVVYVAETIKAAVLLKKMQANKTHIAIIVDEYGGTTGLVTMEDIIEELVGKIYDEHDAIEMREVTELYDGSYTVAGGANVEKFFEMFDEDIDVDATTVNGWVMIELDRLPKVGDAFTYESRHKIFHVRVTSADSRRALMTHIRVEDRPDDDI
ncbi:MAG: HlyC/CorC family transporter [Mogibacterium sp.]|nr:HlyC/CorC family transporter [Mogibacterium sp.]